MFVFEFAFNPAFYYRLAFRLLTQTWLPLLKFTGFVIRGYFSLNLPKDVFQRFCWTDKLTNP